MRIELQSLRVHCIVGAYDRERHAAQPIEVDVQLDLAHAPETWGRPDVLSSSVDYAALTREILFILTETRFRYLESAAYALCHYLLLPRAHAATVERAEVSLRKPEALQGFATPRVSLALKQSERTTNRETKKWGAVDVIWESRDAGLYRLNVNPGAEIPLHEHRAMDEAEMILSPHLLTSGQALPVGASIRWPKHHAHRHENRGSEVASILCVDRPRFDPADEVEVDGIAAPFEFIAPIVAP